MEDVVSFKTEFKRVQKQMYKISKEHGFHDDDYTPEQAEYDSNFSVRYKAQVAQRLMLTVSELSEALEAMRHDNPPDSHISNFTGLEAELADAVIRIMDLAETTNSRLAEAIIAKAAYNANRPHKHGGKVF
jgi:NTP pyrophosphatase (non-canonical NTP hydrolase)